MRETTLDLMRHKTIAIKPDTTVEQTALKMLERNVHQLPVVDNDGKLVGMVKAEDLYSLKQPTIDTVVKPAPLTVPQNISSYEAVRRMEDSGALYAVVVDDQKFVGLITWQDVLETFSDM